MSDTRDIVICQPVRTPIGRHGGMLHDVSAVDLGVATLRGLEVDFSLLSIGRLGDGDRAVVVAGSRPNTVGATNPIRVRIVGTDS